MRTPPHWALPLAIALSILMCTPLAHAAGRPAGSSLGTLAPHFGLPDLTGKVVSLDDYRGRVVVLNFWAFWCDTWKAEMPQLQELVRRQDDLGFHLVAVSVDGTRLPEFQSRTDGGRVPFPVLLDIGGRVRTQYGVTHVPTVVIIDRVGRIRFSAYGYPGNYVVLRELRKIEESSHE